MYENLNRGTAARGSLKRRNSSVKDLIKKMERPKMAAAASGTTAPKRPSPPRQNRGGEEEWVDAEAFFKNPLPPSSMAPPMTPVGINKRVSSVPQYIHQDFEDFDSGCKRSSIIRDGIEHSNMAYF